METRFKVYSDPGHDAYLLVSELRRLGIEPKFTNYHTNRSSRIRSYASYKKPEACDCMVEVTVHDPRIDAGNDDAVHFATDLPRAKARLIAADWAEKGYWASVYNKFTGECLYERSPKGGMA